MSQTPDPLPPPDSVAGLVAPAPSGAPVAARTDGSAVAALVCAILSWFLVPVVLAVVALVLAGRADRAISADPMVSGRGLVTGARWVAWVNLLVAAMAVAFLAAFAVALWAAR